MNILTKFERFVLFNFLRFATLAAVVLLCFAGWVGYSSIRDQQPATHISIADVENEIGHSKPSTNDEANMPPELTPQEKYERLGLNGSASLMFNDAKNRDVLLGWMSTLGEEDRKDFIANLNEISLTENVDAQKINKFKELKLKKLAANPFGRYMDQTKQLAAGLFVIAMVGLVGLFSLVLVLLAIERNTRPVKRDDVIPAPVSPSSAA